MDIQDTAIIERIERLAFQAGLAQGTCAIGARAVEQKKPELDDEKKRLVEKIVKCSEWQKLGVVDPDNILVFVDSEWRFLTRDLHALAGWLSTLK